MENYLKSFTILTDYEINNLFLLSTKKDLKKGDYFICEGEICTEVAFVLNGTLRSFYISDSGEEITYSFILSNRLMT